jgi:dihydroflavonol-4-reductase
LVGANLVRTLLKQGRNVCALVHKDRQALVGLELETISADVRDQEALERTMAGGEVVYHLAGSISVEMDSGPEMQAINAVGTHNVVAACLKCGVRRLVHFSSVDALCHDSLNHSLDENQPLVGSDQTTTGLVNISPYDLSKAQGEREVLASIAYGLETVIIRPTAILGPYDFKPSYLGQALIQLACGRIPALVKGSFDWVDVRDVVAGAIRAEQIASNGACYMLSGNWHTIREVAELIAAFTNQSAPPITVPMWLANAFAPLMLRLASFNGSQPIYTRMTLNVLRGSHRVSSARAVRELGYTTRTLSETIHDALTWFQEHGYLAEKHL